MEASEHAHHAGQRLAVAALRAYWCSSAEAAETLGISRRMVRKLARSGQVEAVRYQGHWLLSRAGVRERLALRGRRTSGAMPGS
jgi:excisionase family DNA binding protein